VKLQKLFRMSPAEIGCRGRQEVLKTVERVGLTKTQAAGSEWEVLHSLYVESDGKSAAELYLEGDSTRAATVMLNHFRSQSGSFFFAGFDEDWDEEWQTKVQDADRQEIIAAAEALCRNEFDLLGYEALRFTSAEGGEIDWHLDSVSGKRAPFVHWSRIDPLNPAQLGDSKVVWELNRHQWLLQLGQAYRFTGEARYARKYVEALTDWMEKNPPGFGVNWSSSLEVSLRLISWCWALMFFRDSPALTPQFFLRLLSSIRSHAKHIERYLSLYYSPNTHLTGEALGLVYAATLFPKFNDAERWCRLGRTVLLDQMEKQILPDGVFFEQSTRYQIYTTEIYLHFLILAERNQLPIPCWVGEKVTSLLDFLLVVRRPDGTMPQIGDADGGCLLPLLRRKPDDSCGLFSVAAAFFRRDDFAWAAQSSGVEVMWLLGAAGRYGFLSLRQKSPTARLNLFTQGGYVVMRNHWRADSHQLIFDVGPLGCGGSSGHGHADMLSIQCSAFGENYLVDAGTGCYTGNLHWRDYFRSTQAHNTITLDDESQACPAGPFSWKARQPSATLTNVVSRAGFTLIDASHDAWTSRDNPVIHRRRVLFVKRMYWVIIDDMQGTTTHDIALRFQFAPLPVTALADDWVLAAGRNGSALLLKTLTNSSTNRELTCGASHPMRGWVSPDYGQRVAAPVLTYKARGVMPLRLVSVLFPVETMGQKPPEVRLATQEKQSGQRGQDDVSVLEIQTGHCRDMVTVSDADVSLQESEPLCAE